MGVYQAGVLIPDSVTASLLGESVPGSGADLIEKAKGLVGTHPSDFIWLSVVDPTRAEMALLEHEGVLL